jgi:hypothetical protein
MRHAIRTNPLRVLLAALLAACTSGIAAQQTPSAIDAATRQQVVDGAIEHMRRGYILDDVYLLLYG